MKKHGMCYVLTAILAGLLAFSTGAVAERPPGVGNGGTHDSGNEPPDYGDLFILYRDEYGIPILTADDCQQPLAAETFEGCLMIDNAGHPLDGQCLIIPVDPATCSVEGPYAIYTQEVDFGRINEARSPDSVFESQLEEASLTLATAGCISLDPAGRPVASSLIMGDNPETPVVEESYVKTSTIDSPLQHLAMYRALMRTGVIGENIDLGRAWIDAAATSLGAAADKSGFVGVDLVVYLNEILGLTGTPESAVLDRACISVKEEVMGVIQHVQKCFLDFSSYDDGSGVLGYTYDRNATFGALPAPAYIYSDTYGTDEGIFEYLHEFDTVNHYFEIAKAQILDVVPELADTYPTGNIGAFATAADDSRAVIDFMHVWPVPGEYATPVPCDISADLYYDVAISDDSGLQVPKRMVAETEGREGTLTISNAGPADASGVVKLIGVDSEDPQEVIGPLYLMDGETITETELFVGPDHTEPFELAAGYSTGWTFYFSMDYATTITWTATVIAEDDVNASNDTVTEVTVVTAVKGGGGGSGGGGGKGGNR